MATNCACLCVIYVRSTDYSRVASTSLRWVRTNKNYQYTSGIMVRGACILLQRSADIVIQDTYGFFKSTSWRHPQKVYNAVPGDFTQDGKLDILVMGQDRPSNQLSIQLYVGLPEGGFSMSLCMSLVTLLAHSTISPRPPPCTRASLFHGAAHTHGHERRPKNRSGRHPTVGLVVQSVAECVERFAGGLSYIQPVRSHSPCVYRST